MLNQFWSFQMLKCFHLNLYLNCDLFNHIQPLIASRIRLSTISPAYHFLSMKTKRTCPSCRLSELLMSLSLYHIRTQHVFFSRSTVTSFGCLNVFFGSSHGSFTLLFLLLASDVCFAWLVSDVTSIVAGALSRLTADGGVVGLGSYVAVTACEESLTSSGDTALELLMSLAKVFIITSLWVYIWHFVTEGI